MSEVRNVPIADLWVLYKDRCEVSILQGKTLTAVERSDDRILFTVSSTERYLMWHEHDCCEGVDIEDINGDLQNLVGTPIVLAEESSNSDDPPKVDPDLPTYVPDSYTWTFYRFRTAKGDVDIRWFGESNGYYSEDVDFGKVAERD